MPATGQQLPVSVAVQFAGKRSLPYCCFIGNRGRSEVATPTGHAQGLVDDAQQHPQGSTLEVGTALQKVAPPLGQRQHPLRHRRAREDAINQMWLARYLSWS